MKKKITASFLALGLFVGGCGDDAFNDLEQEYNSDGTKKVDTSTISDLFNKPLNSSLAANAHDSYEFTATKDALIEVHASWEPSQTKNPNFDVEVYVGEDRIESSSTRSHHSTLEFTAEEGTRYTIKVTNTSESRYDYNIYLANTIDTTNMREITLNKEQNATTNDVSSYYQVYSFTPNEDSEASFSISWKENQSDSIDLDLYLYSDNTLIKDATSNSAIREVLETNVVAGSKYTLFVVADDTNSKDYDYTLESAIYNTTTNTKNIDATTSYSSTLNDTTNRYQLYTFKAQEDGELYSYVTWEEVATYDTNLALYIYEDGKQLTYDDYSDSHEYNTKRTDISKDKFYSILVAATETDEKDMPYTFQTALSYVTDKTKTLHFNTTATGTLNRSTQLIDTYAFTTNEEKSVTLDLNWSEDTTYDTNIELLLYDNGVFLDRDSYSYSYESNTITFNAKVNHNYIIQLITDTVYTKDLDYNLIAH